ncbi:hypothetical protein [Algoriphagus sanaruensis]|uniref:Uncharacterized protein n=1 Tax=Algoriphagus sanaruensis TaxID=1727163 RepID=A0A142EP62_9BACT|nr:hypothetical protein [Algoriphagus sanaruensis]AMQ56917.1 hypothetical protein AO498_10790 [Algoriphagus sanaruensis]
MILNSIGGKLLGLFLGILISMPAFTQSGNPPIPVEWMINGRQANFQLVLKRSFTPTSKFDLLSIAVFTENLNEDKLGENAVIPVQINYNLGKKGFAISAGSEYNGMVGLTPLIGAQHVFANRKILALTVFSWFLNSSQDAKILGLYEFKPMISEKWALYTRLQFMYNRGFSEGVHNRSFLNLRAGLKKGPLGFGLGYNIDRYGPISLERANLGVFTRWEF